MSARAAAAWLVEQEARALLTRLRRVEPLALHETMVLAASPAPAALTSIEGFLLHGRRQLDRQATDFLAWLAGPGKTAQPEEIQRRFTLLRLRFNDVLSQFDLFSDAITQRSERDTGVLLSGLDVAAHDALELPGGFFEAPPVICYLDRGPGAAIRRARTRLPGKTKNPVAIVRVPRERMVGHGIASSLVHEVGHQGAALLGLVESLRADLQGHAARAPEPARTNWGLWARWISEIVADLWSIARVGVTSTLGLIGVVSLPRWFVFRINLDDPHPTPWLRVKLSCAIGDALYPSPQWGLLAKTWEAWYPLRGVDAERAKLIRQVERSIPDFVEVLLDHRAAKLRGLPLRDALTIADRDAERLLGLWRRWSARPAGMRDAAPSQVFAVLGQARIAGELGAEREARLLSDLLTHWALKSTLVLSELCTQSAGVARLRPLAHQPRTVPSH